MHLGQEEVSRQLSQMYESDLFSSSPRKKQLLQYLVDQTLAGNAANIKSYAIGIDVFGRSDDFDPQIDSVVRVQAGSLRKALKMYYLTDGSNDPVIIGLPKGSYVPTFSRNIDVSAPDVPTTILKSSESSSKGFFGKNVPVIFVMAIFLAIIAGGWFWLGNSPEKDEPNKYPIVAVQPFDNLTGNDANDIFEFGFQRQLASDLERFRIFRVVTSSKTTNASIKPDYYISGALIDLEQGYDIMFSLNARDDGGIVRNWRVNFGLEQMRYHDALEEISTLAAAEIAGSQGRLRELKNTDLEARIGIASLNHHDIFRCVVAFDDFIVRKNAARFASAYDCLETELAVYPDDSSLNAMMAWMVALASPEASQGLSLDDDTLEPFTVTRAYELAAKAVASDPRNDMAHTYLGLIEWLNGDRQNALLSLRRAEDINPGDPTTKADLALFLSLSGNWEEGLDYADQAISESALPPPWFGLPNIYRALLDGEGARAEALLTEYGTSGDPYLPHYQFAAASIQGDTVKMEAIKGAIADYASENGGDVMKGLRVWIGDSEVMGLLEQIFRDNDMM